MRQFTGTEQQLLSLRNEEIVIKIILDLEATIPRRIQDEIIYNLKRLITEL